MLQSFTITYNLHYLPQIVRDVTMYCFSQRLVVTNRAKTQISDLYTIQAYYLDIPSCHLRKISVRRCGKLVRYGLAS